MLEDKNPQLTPISAYGEFGLIKHLTAQLEIKQASTKLSVGDDCAVIDAAGQQIVLTTDVLAEGVHFNLGYVPLKHLGYKAVVVNLSDVAAMNAVPTQILVAVAVSNRFPVEALEEIYAGISLACSQYGVDLVGGDTTSSSSGLILTLTAVGMEKAENIVSRTGAQVNDLLVVTGDLGAAYLGLQILEREHAVYLANPNMQPEMEGFDYLLQRQLKPEARTDIKKILNELEIAPTSMIDVSDGLSSDTLHLADQSGVGFRIYEEKIPLDPLMISTADDFNLNPATCALNGGEDYELLFTIRPEDYDKIKDHPDFTVIGHAVEKTQGNFLVARGSNELVALTAQGWDALLNK